MPRPIPATGLVGAPLLIISATATLFDGTTPVTLLAVVATVPIFLWELSPGVWLIAKGFRSSPVTATTAALQTA